MDLIQIVEWLASIEPILIVSLILWILGLAAYEWLADLRLSRWGMEPGSRSGMLLLAGFLILFFALFMPYPAAVVIASFIAVFVIHGNLGWKRKLDALADAAVVCSGFLLMIPQSTDASVWMLCNALPGGLLLLYAALMETLWIRKTGWAMGWTFLCGAAVSFAGWYLQWAFNTWAQLPIGPSAAAISSIAALTVLLAGAGLWMYLQERKHKEKTEPLVLFDLDGTLIDSQPMVFETFRQVFAEMLPDHKLEEEELYSFFGPTLEVTFSRYFSEEKVKEAIDLYQKINLNLHEQMLREMPHAREMLIALKGKGYKLGVVSNKRREPVLLGLKISGLGSYFSLVYGKEDLPKPKPSAKGLLKAASALKVPAERVVYIGDNAADIQAAKNMAAFSIGYTIDARQRKALEEAECCILIDDLMQLADILQEDREWIDKSIW